jgi:lipopolysaccharide transport system ATP-binding protein
MAKRPVILVEHLSKEYRLGVINHGTLQRDLQSWWARIRGRPDPNAIIRESDVHRNVFAEERHHEAVSSGDLGNNGEAKAERFLALDDVSFRVEEGETFGIIGKNGAGKSTLLKILCRITAPTAGRVRVRGRIASLLEVGTGFHPELTGRENVFLNGTILGMTRTEIQRKFDNIVEFSQLERFIDTPVKRYSSGMYVRLAFSVAAHLDAEVLIVDEVLAVGDFEFQKKCLEKLRDVTAKGRTVLLVSHNMSAVQNLCSRAILLRRGCLVSEGETAQVIESYISKASLSSDPIPLALREDRSGSGLFHFVETRVQASPSIGQNTVKVGGDAVIQVWLSNNQSYPLHDVDVALGVDNYIGERVTIFTTNAVAATIPMLPPGKSLVEFEIPNLPFVQGRYFYTLFGTAGGVVADWVQSASSFEVLHGDFFRTGRSIPSGQGSILVPYTVCHREADSILPNRYS